MGGRGRRAGSLQARLCVAQDVVWVRDRGCPVQDRLSGEKFSGKALLLKRTEEELQMFSFFPAVMFLRLHSSGVSRSCSSRAL